MSEFKLDPLVVKHAKARVDAENEVARLQSVLYWLASTVSTEWMSPTQPVREALEAAYTAAAGLPMSKP